MGIAVMILGASGSGKSTSLRNFEPDEVGVFNVASKPLPFRKKLKVVNNATYGLITKVLSNPQLKKYTTFGGESYAFTSQRPETSILNYGKFTNMALNFRNLIDYVIKKTPDDVIVYFLHHTELSEDGRLKAKTLGKMLDNQLTVEGLFSIVLLCQTEGSEHYFITNSDGSNPAKSPLDMFPMRIDNDLKFVDKTIREYYEMEVIENNNNTEEKEND